MSSFENRLDHAVAIMGTVVFTIVLIGGML